ncbi:MAG: hypothetical protein ACPGFB_07665 [Verrucomicrobiales bacterium]
MRRPPSILLGCLWGVFSLTTKAADIALPEPVTPDYFQSLLEQSPFTRPLDLSGALILTGVAEVDGAPVATVIDTENGYSFAVSTFPDNRGWKLVELPEMDDIEIAVASIAVDGGQVIKVYYDEDGIREAVKKRNFKNTSRTMVMAVRTGTYTLPHQIQKIEDPAQRGQAIGKLIEGGAFDQAPFQAVDMALAQSHPKTRGPVLSAAFGRLGGGVGGVEYQATVNRLNTLSKGHDRDFAINGLAHGLAGQDPDAALKWANSISNEGFRRVVVENVSRRINGN